VFEQMSYEGILQRMLNRVPNTFDKREGSIIFDALAPAAMEMMFMFIELENLLKETFADTASREYLIKRTAERGIAPYPASKASLKAKVTPESLDVKVGSRFSLNELNYTITSKIQDGYYIVECETEGAIGNKYFGSLIPIDYVDGLESIEITELLIPGEDEEDTEALRTRYFGSFNTQAFGGNQSDYKEKVSAMPGVGGVKIHPAWNADISPAAMIPCDAVRAWYDSTISALEKPVRDWLSAVYGAASAKKLTVGGAVRVVVLASDFSPPSEVLVEDIQTALDPTQNAGEGFGIAPIGHVVTVEGVRQQKIDVELTLTFAAGWSWEAAASYVNTAIDNYFGELARSWEKSDSLIVRISQIESRILAECSRMVADIGGTKLNGLESNVTLDADSIPIRGDVSG